MNVIIKNKCAIISVVLCVFAIICFAGCSKDSNPASFADDYTPTYKETIGTSYAGDYFPFDEGYFWEWNGNSSVNGNMILSGDGETITNSIDKSNVPVYGARTVKKAETHTFKSGTYEVFPSYETSNMEFSLDGASSAGAEIVRYFEKTSEAVYIRAIKTGDGDIIEVENPVYIKTPLVVGDKWETYPRIDWNMAMGMVSSDQENQMDVNFKCVFYVVGKEEKEFNGQNVETIQLDQRAEIKLTQTLQGEGTININITYMCYMYLLEDVGIVSYDEEFNLSMNASINVDGMVATVKIDMDTTADVSLSDYSFDVQEYSVSKIQSPRNENVLAKASTVFEDNVNTQKQKQIINRILTIVRNLSL